VLSKVPWNLLRNVFGLDMWTNVNTACGTPVWKHPFHLGAVDAVGFCGISPLQPLLVLQGMVTTFGVLPVLAVWLWWRNRAWRSQSVLLRFCLCYGAISFVLAPLIGVWFYRLFGYAWPLLLIGVPSLFRGNAPQSRGGIRSWKGVLFCVIHLGCCGLTFAQQVPRMVLMEAALWVAAALVLWSPSGASGEASSAAA
jgi:hypothetical protein